MARSVKPFALLGAMLFAVGSAGCIVPPVRADVGGGARAITSAGEPREVDTAFALRVGAHPLGLVPSNTDRRFDFGVGYVLDAGPNGTVQGGYLSEEAFVMRAPATGGTRIGVELQERVVASSAGTGAGAALRLDFGYADFARAKHEEKKLYAGAYGEGAIGFFVEGDATFIEGARYATVLGGLTFTFPVAGAIAVK